jgi:uncharacterized protein
MTTPDRPLWLRIAQSPVTRLIVLGSIVFYLMANSNMLMEKFKGSSGQSVAAVLGISALALGIYIAYARFIERRAVDELSLAGAGRDWLTGAAIGAGLYSACVLILMAMGIYRIEGLNPWTFVLPALAMALSSGIFEELLFRGVLHKSVEDLFGSWVALVVSALVFGLVHLLNPAGTLEGALFISIEAGILLAAAYMLTRKLWLSIGFHMSWNYVQSAIFSGIVSGSVTDPGLIRSNIKGPEVLTGGNFGLESSIIAFTLCTTTGLVLLYLAVKRGKLLPRAGKR